MNAAQFAATYPHYCRACSGIGGHKASPDRMATECPECFGKGLCGRCAVQSASVHRHLPDLRLASLHRRRRATRRALHLTIQAQTRIRGTSGVLRIDGAAGPGHTSRAHHGYIECDGAAVRADDRVTVLRHQMGSSNSVRGTDGLKRELVRGGGLLPKHHQRPPRAQMCERFGVWWSFGKTPPAWHTTVDIYSIPDGADTLDKT